MTIEKISTKLPYVISGVFFLFVLLVVLNKLGLHVYLPFNDPCQDVFNCVIDSRPLNLLVIAQVLSMTVLGILLTLQMLIHTILFFKK